MRRFWVEGIKKLKYLAPAAFVVMYPISCNVNRICLECENPNVSRMIAKSDKTRGLNHIGGHKLFISDKISLTDSTTTGRGWVCKNKSAAPGETLLSVPSPLILNAQNIELDGRLGNVVGPLRSAGLDDRGVLALWYLINRKSRTDEWLSYLDLLPNYYNASKFHLLLSNDVIPGTAVSYTLDRMRLNISRQLRSILVSLRQLDPKNPILLMDERELEQEWKLCHSLVLSRSGLFDGILEGTRWTDQPIAVIPGIDFVNHSDRPNSKIIKDTAGTVRLVATRAIDPGTEITIAYWPVDTIDTLSLEQVLFTFGFLGGSDRFALPIISFDGFESDKKRAIQRLIYVESRQFDDATATVYTEDLDVAVDYFTIDCMPKPAVSDLISSIISEGGVKSNSRRILLPFRASGIEKLRSEVLGWRGEIVKAHVMHPALVEYQRRLVSAIDLLLIKLS
jgi:hypothetical protein